MTISELSILTGYRNNNDFNNVSAPVFSAAENYRGYQQADKTGGPGDGSYKGNS